MKISIIVPTRNEEANLSELYKKLKGVLALNNFSYQIIFINDASTDDSINVINKIISQDRNCQLVNFEKHKGQTAAISSGLEKSKYDLIGIIDADLQCDPADLIRLIEKINKGYDYVGGLRTNRDDDIFLRTASKFGNLLRNFVLKENFFDSTTSLKIFKKNTLTNIELKTAWHRYLPSLIAMQGFRVCEIPVKHYSRQHGHSKYNIFNRILPSLKALAQIKKLQQKFK